MFLKGQNFFKKATHVYTHTHTQKAKNKMWRAGYMTITSKLFMLLKKSPACVAMQPFKSLCGPNKTPYWEYPVPLRLFVSHN